MAVIKQAAHKFGWKRFNMRKIKVLQFMKQY